eukprot:m.5359 g.5359  ORF g.5359 m.5359 type:complete len:1017 (-) comp2390_c0_seq1:140-3190(-)
MVVSLAARVLLLGEGRGLVISSKFIRRLTMMQPSLFSMSCGSLGLRAGKTLSLGGARNGKMINLVNRFQQGCVPLTHSAQSWSAFNTFRLFSSSSQSGDGNDDDCDDASKESENGKQAEEKEGGEEGEEEEGTSILDKGSLNNAINNESERKIFDKAEEDDKVQEDVNPFEEIIAGRDSDKIDKTTNSQDGDLVKEAAVPPAVENCLVTSVQNLPLLPHTTRVLTVKDKDLIQRLWFLRKMKTPYIGVFMEREPGPRSFESELSLVKSSTDLFDVGVLCEIQDISSDGQDQQLAILAAHYPIKLKNLNQRLSQKEGETIMTPTTGDVERIDMDSFDIGDLRLKALVMEVMKNIREIMASNSVYRENLLSHMHGKSALNDIDQICSIAVSGTTSPGDKVQALLEETNIEKKVSLVLELLQAELLNLQLQDEIRESVQSKVQERNKKYLLEEQLVAIKEELGLLEDETEAIVKKFLQKLEGLEVPDNAKEVIDQEISKLSSLDARSSEFQVTRNYLDWLTSIPWGKTSEEVFDVERGLEILDEDHYGMQDVKDRILEFIAVGALKQSSQGKIMTFVGPPGVGKTSIAKSIAKALNRTYFRFSVGGLHDVAEIKGHRRTYVGAIPGKAIQALKLTQTINPLILLDEVDKIGAARNGDPSSALLELLDPEQNSQFHDHYLDVPVDMSRVLFLCTANVLDTIPSPLKDRMEIIELSGYMLEEKVMIAKNYLLKWVEDATGVSDKQLVFEEGALETVITQYCRESGVRNLRNQLEKIFRKVALKIVREKLTEPIRIRSETVKDFLGLPWYTSEKMYDETPPGVILGLAWTALGGSTLYIETTIVPTMEKDSGSLHLTGSLGDVMKESASIAYNVAKLICHNRFQGLDLLQKAKVSLHVPEGATPKDGPSAGVTMVSAFLSLATNVPVRQNFAMTGEVSLTGKVLKVGGIKEKLLAARREGVTCVVLPDQNRMDYDDLPKPVKDDVEVHFAKTIDDVITVAFGDDFNEKVEAQRQKQQQYKPE